PSAPADDGPSFAPSPLSIPPMAASTVQDRPGQYSAADSRYRSSQFAGRPAGTVSSTGRLVTAVTGTRFRTVPPVPRTARTWDMSGTRSTAGALHSSATSVVRPSRSATSRLTIASTPGIPSSAVAQNPTCSQAAAETG